MSELKMFICICDFVCLFFDCLFQETQDLHRLKENKKLQQKTRWAHISSMAS